MFIAIVMFFLGVAWWIDQSNAKAMAPTATEEIDTLDVLIPDGFALVPIAIQNLASLDALVGQFAVVDIYTEGGSTPIATGLRLIRSPRDPSQFSVLVSNEHSSEIVSKSVKPLQVVVQNPNQQKSHVNKKRNSKIVWEN